MEKKIIGLLKETAEPGAVTEETISNIAVSLVQKIGQLESAMRNGDITVKTYEKELHKNNLKEVDDAFKHAHALRESRYSNESMKAELNNLLWEMNALKKYMQATRSTSQGGLPKPARMYFCASIIVAWKLIKNTDVIPGRQKNAGQEPGGEFHVFIKVLLTAAGGHVANINADELHRDIQEVAKELERIRTPEPELIDLSDHPAGLWGK
ncbi:hypothetical protein [Halomonas dongshanensis]|uniref:Uncharacterized protein n=1 Tax=Halomonas dongshanensis TaxID=2890835 RepID=A0ABT2E8C3_9GAMM|nr:hypothetical protein [Halomonas dongshanensis]MCS2607749.1 hypothetical protein [Halomonas dongshanensis]